MVQYSCQLIAIRRHCPELEWAVNLFPPSLVIAQVDTLIESVGLCEFFDHTQKEKCSRVKRQVKRWYFAVGLILRKKTQARHRWLKSNVRGHYHCVITDASLSDEEKA